MPEELAARLAAAGGSLRARRHPVDLSRLVIVLTPDAPPSARELEEQDQAADIRRMEREIAAARKRDEPGGQVRRWWCTFCSAYAASEHAPCAKCRDPGPHVYAEESPLAVGGASARARRARLRADHKRANRVRR